MVTLELFATNLINPSHMEWTPDGRLLVSEHTAGRVKDVTDGGDMRDVEPVAVGLEGPASILPLDDGRILVSETWGGRVRDISRGGDVSKYEPFASDLSMPYSLVRRSGKRGERIFVSESFGPHHAQITMIREGGTREDFKPYIARMPSIPGAPGLTPLKAWPGRWEEYAAAGCVKNWEVDSVAGHFVAVGPLGQILDVTDGGGEYMDLIQERIVAWGLGRMGGMFFNERDERLYAVEPDYGSVVAIDPRERTNYRFEPRVVRGLNFPTCPRFADEGTTLFVCSSGDGAIWRVTDFLR